MLKDKIKTRIERRLAVSQLRHIVAEEVNALLAEKPDDMPTDEFCGVVAELVLEQLHTQLCQSVPVSEPDSETTERVSADSPPNLGQLIKRVASEVEYALLSGNLQMVKALGGAIAQRDTGTSAHNLRVVLYSANLAKTIGRSRPQMQALIKGAFLHDIGKIGIPDHILLKSGGLTAEERELMNSHTERGATIIEGVRWLDDALDVVRYHHERFDGSGYPDGLAGDSIPTHARIFTVADVFDALTSERPYKEAHSLDESLKAIRNLAGTQFDPDIVDVFDEIAPTLYLHLARADLDVLNDEVTGCVHRHFGIDMQELVWS
ncbi:HD domain-containing protein [candidate division GN15 bacterium]|nr:HD domain-containing protein [candidate division GN15 bacterium]